MNNIEATPKDPALPSKKDAHNEKVMFSKHLQIYKVLTMHIIHQ